MVRNSYHQLKKVTTAAGVVDLAAPRVNDKRVDEQTGERKRFSSATLPPWCRTSRRTANPIESAFSAVRLRTKVTRGAGSRTATLATVFALVESARQWWRAVNTPHLVALVGAGARFERGRLVGRIQEAA